MKMIVNHQLLDEVINSSIKSSEELYKQITGMQSDINNLKAIWQGQDAEMFYAKLGEYLEKVKSVPETYDTLAVFMKKANISYKQADEAFANDMQKVRNEETKTRI